MKSAAEQKYAKTEEYRPFGNLADCIQVSGFSARSFGNMSFRYADASGSLNNRKQFLDTLNINYKHLVCAKQIHSNRVRYATEADRGKGALSYDSSVADADALITDKRSLPLAVFTADCLPIFLYDPETPAVGLIHAGWRSTKQNIAAEAIRLMQREFNTNPRRLYAGLGPCIRACCYGVGEDFRDIFPHGLITKDGACYLDLAAVNKKEILGLGVNEENISDTLICSSCRMSDFFSYRKEGQDCCRMMSVIMLRA